MSRSQPKPKIIYKNLEEIINNSSYSKSKPPKTSTSNPKMNKNVPKTFVTSLQGSRLKKSTSRHSLNSKEKIVMGKGGKKERESSLLKEMFKQESRDERYQQYSCQVEKIYEEMEKTLAQAKLSFTQKMQKNPLQFDSNLRQLQKMSKCMKELFSFFLEKSRFTSSTSSQKERVLTQISCNQQNVSKLSIQNQKRRKNNRLAGGGQRVREKENEERKPTIYQLVLMKKM